MKDLWTRVWQTLQVFIYTQLYAPYNFICAYCAFHKHANSKVQKPRSQLRFWLPSIIITITSNEPWNTETHKTERNPPIKNQKPWPFEPVKVKFCFLRGPLRWLTAAKNAIVSWLLNFRIRMFLKSAVTSVFWSITFKTTAPQNTGSPSVLCLGSGFRGHLVGIY